MVSRRKGGTPSPRRGCHNQRVRGADLVGQRLDESSFVVDVLQGAVLVRDRHAETPKMSHGRARMLSRKRSNSGSEPWTSRGK